MLRNIWRTEGFRALYRGVIPPLMGVGGINAVLFGSYGLTARALGVERNHLTLPQVFFCGSVGGFASSNISVPTELLKIRAQTLKSTTDLQSGGTSTWREARRLVHAHGPFALFRVRQAARV